jgi:hypothetical protein
MSASIESCRKRDRTAAKRRIRMMGLLNWERRRVNTSALFLG